MLNKVQKAAFDLIQSDEREWRVPGELCFEYSQCEIIVPNSKYYKKFVKYCLDKNREDILLKIRGIVVIASVYF